MREVEGNRQLGPDEDDALARLLRLAGPRPATPEERTDRVRAAVRKSWLAEIQSRARLRWYAWALASAAALVVVAWATLKRGGPVPGAAPPVASLEAQSGAGAEVFVPGAERVTSLALGQAIVAHSEVRTGSDGRAALRLASGASLRIDLGTRVLLLTASELRLDRGAVYVDSVPRADRGLPLRVHTPFGVAQDLGTQFEVRIVENALRLRVREGQVVLRRGDLSESALAGSELTARAAGGLDRRPVAVDGPEWGWAIEIAPSFEIEGQSLDRFLGWVSRETGWRLRFASADTSRAAPSIVLHDSVRGLTPAEALAAVLPTCGLTHRVSEGTLVVEPRSSRVPRP